MTTWLEHLAQDVRLAVAVKAGSDFDAGVPAVLFTPRAVPVRWN
jgi:hypothetical protein